MNIEKLRCVADQKWQAFYRAATAAGVWFIAFATALALSRWSDGAGIFVAMLIVSFSFMVVTGLLMLCAMLEAQSANRKISATNIPAENQAK